MNLPDLYLIGAPKAGTTSISQWLSVHPDVFWSTPKEPYYWATDFPRMRQHYGFDTLNAYRRLYSSSKADAAQVRGDGSTTYLYSAEAVPAILSAVPSARFIVCLRNPVDLVLSYHRTQLVALNESEPDFLSAWHRSRSGSIGTSSPLDAKLLNYPFIGCLGQQVQRLLSTVEHDRVHAIVFDDLVARPEAVWDALATFVGIDPAQVPSFAVANRSDKMYRWSRLRRLTHRPPGLVAPQMRSLRQWSRTTRFPGVAAMKQQMWRTEPRPDLPQRSRAEFAEFFADDVRLLSALVDRDLTDWFPTPDGTPTGAQTDQGSGWRRREDNTDVTLTVECRAVRSDPETRSRGQEGLTS